MAKKDDDAREQADAFAVHAFIDGRSLCGVRAPAGSIDFDRVTCSGCLEQIGPPSPDAKARTVLVANARAREPEPPPPPRPVLHAHGFDSRSVGVTMYQGDDLATVSNRIVNGIRAAGHEVTVTTTRPLGGAELVAVDLAVIVHSPDGSTTPMWHRLSYPDDPWYS
jgi:hypothetical protein